MNYYDLKNILLIDKPSTQLRKCKNDLFSLIPEFYNTFQFDQKTVWHTKDVFEHILMVVDGVEPDYRLRLAALFHDVGKPYTFFVDENGKGHFHGHWEKSENIFQKYKENFFLSEEDINLVCKLIYYHDLTICSENLSIFKNEFSEDEMSLLFSLKRADILAHNKIFVSDILKELEAAKDSYYHSLTILDNYKEQNEYD